MLKNSLNSRKIIHIDMDCFYAAIEMRDNPTLTDLPVAVGGSKDSRGVLCTCNYIARRYGIHSAMPTARAIQLCKELIVIPPNMKKYKEIAASLQKIFKEYTALVEPLALDEAYLDVSNSPFCQGSATLIAKEIRARIWDTEQLTASAGVAPNKLLAKIASGWKKPNGLFVITPREVEDFIKNLSVKELFGVGKVTANKLYELGLNTCVDLQQLSLQQLINLFGKQGEILYFQCRGIDHRAIEPNRERKSLSVEHTFASDINDRHLCVAALKCLYGKLIQRLEEMTAKKPIKNQFIKIKFSNFRQITTEKSVTQLNFAIFEKLFTNSFQKDKNAIRLLGIGIHFKEETEISYGQHSIFD